MPNIRRIRTIHVRHRRYCTNHNNRAHHNIAHHNTVDRNTPHVIFLMHFARHVRVHTHCMTQDEPSLRKCLWCAFHSILMSSMMCVWAFVGCPLSFSLTCFSPSFTSSLPHSTWFLPGTPSMSTTPRVKTAAHPHNEEYCPMAIYNPLTGYEPKLLDDFDHSETSAMIFQDESGDIDTEPSYLCDAELDDATIAKAPSSQLFIQEREEPANWRQAYHSHEESLLPAQTFFAHTSTVRPVYEASSPQKRKSSRDMENERIRILLGRQKRANSRWC